MKAPTSLQRKLHRWELQHLRTLVAEQQAQIETQAAQIAQLQSDVTWAEDRADSWCNYALSDINDAGLIPGLTLGGTLVAVQPGATQ